MIKCIEPNKTVRKEIIDWFGPPTQLVVENNREQFIYKSCSKKTEDFVPATGVYSDRMLQDAMDGRCEILIIIIDRVSQRVTGIERKFNDNEESSFN